VVNTIKWISQSPWPSEAAGRSLVLEELMTFGDSPSWQDEITSSC
jgi:hypothetical protein